MRIKLPVFPDFYNLMAFKGSKKRKELKSALFELEMGYKCLFDELVGEREINSHRVWVAEGDILSALREIQDYLKKYPLTGVQLDHKLLLEEFSKPKVVNGRPGK